MAELHFVEDMSTEEQECLRHGDFCGQRPEEGKCLASFQSLFQKVSGYLKGEEVRARAKEAAGPQVTRYLETMDHGPTTL